jgi:hypothetical protein
VWRRRTLGRPRLGRLLRAFVVTTVIPVAGALWLAKVRGCEPQALARYTGPGADAGGSALLCLARPWRHAPFPQPLPASPVPPPCPLLLPLTAPPPQNGFDLEKCRADVQAASRRLPLPLPRRGEGAAAAPAAADGASGKGGQARGGGDKKEKAAGDKGGKHGADAHAQAAGKEAPPKRGWFGF